MTDHTDVVARVKESLIDARVSIAGPCGAFEITRRVLWELRGEGWGYVAAPAGGENCTGYRTDKAVRPGGTFVDCLIDAGGANGPAWQQRAATPDEVAAFRPLVDPGPMPVPVAPPAPGPDPVPAPVPEPDPVPEPTPAPVPAPVPAVDVLAELRALEAKLDAVTAGDATVADAMNHLRDTIAALQSAGVRIHF